MIRKLACYFGDHTWRVIEIREMTTLLECFSCEQRSVVIGGKDKLSKKAREESE